MISEEDSVQYNRSLGGSIKAKVVSKVRPKESPHQIVDLDDIHMIEVKQPNSKQELLIEDYQEEEEVGKEDKIIVFQSRNQRAKKESPPQMKILHADL